MITYKESKASRPHQQLANLVGDWEGKAKVWFEPGQPADESGVKGNMRLVLDGRFLMHEYKGSMEGKPLEGMAIIGFNTSLEKFEVAWIDSFHTGTALMFSGGKRGDRNLDVLGSYAYVTPEDEQHWGWRTALEIINDDEVLLTAFNISPEGEETKATETSYKRVTPY